MMETPSGVHVITRGNVPLLNEKGDVKYIYITYSDITRITKNQDYIGHEIEGLSKVIAKIADCDLTAHYDVTRPDEDTKESYKHIVKLRDGVRAIVINLKNAIGDVNKKMQNLTSDAENATRSIEEGSKGVQEIAQDATKVSGNAEKASQGVDQIAKAMQDMSAAVEEITSSMESVSNLTKQTNDLSQSGAALAGKAAKGMSDISASTTKVHEIVTDVEKQMERSPRSLCSSASWPTRPTCWHSMLLSKLLVPERQGEVLLSLQQK